MGKWVKCSEGLPEHLRRVKVHQGFGRVFGDDAYWDASYGEWRAGSGYLLKEPDEWYDDQPEPPKDVPVIVAKAMSEHVCPVCGASGGSYLHLRDGISDTWLCMCGQCHVLRGEVPPDWARRQEKEA